MISKEYGSKNFTFHSEVMLSVFPTGDYKMIFQMYDKLDRPIVNVTIVANFKSSNRDSFG